VSHIWNIVSLEPKICSYSVKSILKVSHTDLNDPWYSRNFEIELLSKGLPVGYGAFCRCDRNVPIDTVIYLIGVIYCTVLL
jgi:hypothetical protein